MTQTANQRLRPYMNWTEDELLSTLVSHVKRLNIPEELRDLWIVVIEESFESPYWNVIQDYNGCTIVQDHFHPCPACFVHDYMWIAGCGGRISDRIFLKLMEAEGMSKNKSRFRWFGVRVGWVCYFYWSNIKRRNLKNPTPNMVKLYKNLYP